VEWISVEVAEPELDVDVIAMDQDGDVYKLHLEDFDGRSYWFDRSGYQYAFVDYWIPIPPKSSVLQPTPNVADTK